MNNKQMILDIARKKDLTGVTIDGIKIHLMDIISPTLKNDMNFMKELIKEDYHIFRYLNENFKSDSRFIESILTKENYYIVLDSMDEQLKNDKTFARKILEKYPDALSYFSEDIRYDEEFIELMFEGAFFTTIILVNKLSSDKIFAKKVLEKYPIALSCFSEEIKNDAKLIESVLTEENADIIMYNVGKEYALENKEIVKRSWLNILNENPNFYIDIKDIFPYDIDLAEVAVSNDKSGIIYHMLTDELKENSEIKSIAVIKPIDELVKEIVNKLPDKLFKTYSDSTNSLTYNQDVVDVDALVNRIDEKIAQIEVEEENKD